MNKRELINLMGFIDDKIFEHLIKQTQDGFFEDDEVSIFMLLSEEKHFRKAVEIVGNKFNSHKAFSSFEFKKNLNKHKFNMLFNIVISNKEDKIDFLKECLDSVNNFENKELLSEIFKTIKNTDYKEITSNIIFFIKNQNYYISNGLEISPKEFSNMLKNHSGILKKDEEDLMIQYIKFLPNNSENGMDRNKAIISLASNGHISEELLIKCLKEKLISPDILNSVVVENPLMFGIYPNSEEKVKLLIDNNADLKACDESGFNIMSINKAMAKYFIKYIPDELVNIKDKNNVNLFELGIVEINSSSDMNHFVETFMNKNGSLLDINSNGISNLCSLTRKFPIIVYNLLKNEDFSSNKKYIEEIELENTGKNDLSSLILKEKIIELEKETIYKHIKGENVYSENFKIKRI